MRQFYFIALGFIASLTIGGCATLESSPATLDSPPQRVVSFAGHEGVPIDQVPRYGDLDRSADPQLVGADRRFIDSTTAEFGSRAAASKIFADYGFRLYQENKYMKAMQRLNQAWLLDPESPLPYWGFAVVLHDHGLVEQEFQWMNEALDHGLQEPIGLADAGFTYATYSGSELDLAPDEREQCKARSEELLDQALRSAEGPARNYVISNWGFARLAVDDLPGALAKVEELRALGIEDQELINKCNQHRTQ